MTCAIPAALFTAVACGTRESPSRSEPRAIQQAQTSAGAAKLLEQGDSVYFAAAYDSARALDERAAALAGEQGDSATVARALTSLGLIAWRQGRFDDARAIGERALALKQRLGLEAELARSFNALGLLAQAQGELDEASRHFVSARAAAEAVHDSGYIAKARGNLGLVYKDLGDFDRARIEMVALRDAAAASGDKRSETNALNNLGMLETRIGDPDRAIAWLSDARGRYESIDYAVGLENSLGQLGVAYSQRGEPSRALAYFDSALAIATKHGMREAEADDLEIMAEIYENAGDHARALDLLRRARAACDSLEMQTKLGHVALAEARVYAALGNQQLARARAEEAARRQRSAKARMDELGADLFVAELSQRTGDAKGAAAWLSTARTLTTELARGTARITFALGAARVADLARRPADVLSAIDGSRGDVLLLTADEQAELESLRARAYFRMGRHDLAAEAGRRAVTSFERIRGNLGAGTLRASYTADRVGVYADLVVTLLTLGRVEEAFRVADGARGRGLIEHLGAASRGLASPGSRPDIAAAENLLLRIDLLVERLRTRDSVKTPNRDRALELRAGKVERELATARREYEATLERLGRADPASAVLGVRTIGVAAIRRTLDPTEALIEFLSADDRLVIFVLTRDRVRHIEVPAGRVELAERVHLAHELIASRDTRANAPLLDLYSKLISPVERAGFLDGIRSLIVVPHAALSYLPFAALRSRDSLSSGQYLVERYTLTTLGSASSLQTIRDRPIATLASAATVVAPLPSELPATRDEAAAVGARMARPRIAIGATATEGFLREALLSSSIVHVASHGALNGESPMFSSVRLAPPGTPRNSNDNARLETHEVLSMSIRSELVFLSGCETALGTAWSSGYARGDDYATLAQAFLFAGAHNVVATLWRIDDRGAADFADRFYERLASAAPGEALAAAQRAFIRNNAYSQPYYWAAYTLSGSGRTATRPLGP